MKVRNFWKVHPINPLITSGVFGNFIFERKTETFVLFGDIPSRKKVLPKIVISLRQNSYFDGLSLSPVFLIQLNMNMAVMFSTKFSKVDAAVPISSTYWKHWSTTMQSYKFFRKKELNALTDLLRPCV